MTSRIRLWTAASAAVCVIPALTVATTPGTAQAAAQAVACTAPITIPAGGVAPRADQTTVVTGNTGTVFDPAGADIAWAPRAFGADVVRADGSLSKQITVGYSRTTDVSKGAEPADAGARVSSDSGATFTTAPSSVPMYRLGDVANLLDGRLLGAQFVINGGFDTSVAGQVTIPLVLNLSADKGRSWTPVSARTVITDAQMPQNQANPNVASIRGVRTAGKPIQMTGGTIAIPVYFAMKYTETSNILYAALLTAKPGFTGTGAIDTSAPWQFTMRTITSNPTVSFNETAVIERQDGALLAVTRRETSPAATLSYRISADEGRTWSVSTVLTFADQPGCAVSGVLPQLAMLPTGQLVLSSGRPDNWLAISTDASGTSWTQEQQTYWNQPTNGGLWWYGSSGYTSLMPTGVNRLLQFADNCQAPNASKVNGCASALNFEKGRDYRIVNRQVAILPPGLGKIDLLGKLRHGTVTLTTDLHGVPPVGAVTPPTPYGSGPSAADATSTPYWRDALGAVDGSTAFWSGALSSREDGSGTYQLKLDRTYRLTKIGLALLPGAAATAQLDVSADGETWTPATTVSTSGDRAMRYYNLDATARHLRIRTDATSCAAVGGPARCSMINELELYSTVNSFENEAAIPRGLTDLACTRMTSVWANGDLDHDSNHGVRIIDGGNDTYCDGATTIGKFTYPGPGVSLPAASARTLQAGVQPVTITNGLLVDINGVRSDGTTGPVYHLGINNGRRWAAYTDAGGWAGLGGAAVPLGAWTTFQVVASTTGATLYTVDAAGERTLIGTIPKTGSTGITSITGYSFASGSTEGVGDQAVYDDISFD
ncbi:discoidin domain-containing protein [Actinoplanes sp. NPDC023714]|uniref:discoidin domain-containing protein n=1 Tax=Actinoplanes sp. NPDC023714 TaxID=3154322 RepID=UPI0033F1EB38